MRKVLVPVAVLLAPLSAAPEAAAKTTVHVEGTVVIIHVPIWIHSLDSGQPKPHPETRKLITAQELADYWATETERAWNKALGTFRYKDCYTFRLEVEMIAGAWDFKDPGPFVREGLAYGEGLPAIYPPGYHYILYQGSNPNIVPRIYDPATTNPNDDTTSAYDRSLIGEIGYTWPYIHEVGHLLGFGDDYDHETGDPIDGRGETFMGTGGTVDQTLVDRLAKLIEDSGTKLPECWKGTWREENEAGRSDGNFTLTVAPDGVVRGEGTGTQVVTAGGKANYSVTISGTRDEDAFHLTFSGEAGSLGVVATIRGDTANGPWRTGVAQSVYGGTITLECATCEPDGG